MFVASVVMFVFCLFVCLFVSSFTLNPDRSKLKQHSLKRIWIENQFFMGKTIKSLNNNLSNEKKGKLNGWPN